MLRQTVCVAILAIGLAGGLAVGLGMGGCYTPQVPVPPPGPEAFTMNLTNRMCDPLDPPAVCDPTETVLSVEVNAGSQWGDAWVSVRNDTTGEGLWTRSDVTGHAGPTGPIAAAVGDRILIGYERDEDGQAFGTCILAHDGVTGTINLCP